MNYTKRLTVSSLLLFLYNFDLSWWFDRSAFWTISGADWGEWEHVIRSKSSSEFFALDMHRKPCLATNQTSRSLQDEDGTLHKKKNECDFTSVFLFRITTKMRVNKKKFSGLCVSKLTWTHGGQATLSAQNTYTRKGEWCLKIQCHVFKMTKSDNALEV